MGFLVFYPNRGSKMEGSSPKKDALFSCPCLKEIVEMKRYCLTLLEIMIALSLAAIVLSLLFSSLYQSVKLKSQGEVGSAVVLNRAEIQSRLNKVFAHLSELKRMDQKEGLTFQFNNLVDPQVELSDLIQGSLYLQEGKLILALINRDVKRSELLGKASSLTSECLYLNEEKIKRCESWDGQSPGTPLCLKLTIDKVPFVFWINHEKVEIPISR